MEYHIKLKFNPWVAGIGLAILAKMLAVVVSTPEGPPTLAIAVSVIFDFFIGLVLVCLSFIIKTEID